DSNGLDLDDRGGADGGDGTALSIQELQDADDAALRNLHRHHKHRLRPVSVLPVEPVVETVRGAGGKLPHVRDVQGRTARRHETGDRGVVERKRAFDELETYRVVLRSDELQDVFPSGGGLDQVETPAVCPTHTPTP